MGRITLSRREFYDQVWTEPIVRLAQRYGFSDVWLARICKRNKIPRPPRGYWARIQSGQVIPKTPLTGDDSKIIDILIHEPNRERAQIRSDKINSSKRLLKSIVLPNGHVRPHPLVSGSASIFESAACDDDGLVVPQKGCLDIHVSRECLPRALDIMDALIQNVTAMGFEVILSENRTLVTREGVPFSIAIYEELDRRRRLKAVDHNLEDYYHFGYCMYEQKKYPSGRLSFSIDGLGFESQHRKAWKDTETKTLEDNMKGIIASLIRMAAAKKDFISKREASHEDQ